MLKKAFLKFKTEVLIFEGTLCCFFCSFACDRFFKRNLCVQSKVVYVVKMFKLACHCQSLKHDHIRMLV